MTEEIVVQPGWLENIAEHLRGRGDFYLIAERDTYGGEWNPAWIATPSDAYEHMQKTFDVYAMPLDGAAPIDEVFDISVELPPFDDVAAQMTLMEAMAS